jgi:hypothetical protein
MEVLRFYRTACRASLGLDGSETRPYMVCGETLLLGVI